MTTGIASVELRTVSSTLTRSALLMTMRACSLKMDLADQHEEERLEMEKKIEVRSCEDFVVELHLLTGMFLSHC